MMMEAQDAESNLANRTMPKKRQLQWLGLALGMIGIIFGFIWIGARLFAQQQPIAAGEPLPPNTFCATDTQMANLKIETVTAERFRSEEVTDGKIALNADTTTPVFSPYSGRVVKLLVGIGEYVKKGAPLIAIDATEYSQAQSDLRNAQAQWKLTQINEARKHACAFT